MFLLRHHHVNELYLDPKTPVHKRMANYQFVHYIALFLGIFFYISLWQFILFSYYTLFMLHFVDAAPFPCHTFMCINFFMLHYFHVVLFPCCTLFIWHNFVFCLCCTLFMYCTISCCTLTRCKVFVLHTSPLASLVWCTLFMLYYFRGAAMTPTKSESFATTINKAVNYCCKVLYLRCSWGPWLCLYFHVALSSYCNLLILKNIERRHNYIQPAP